MNQNGPTVLTTLNTDTVFERLREILCDILVLRPEDVQRESKLVDDLDADSIAFLELTYRIRSDFGLEVPQAKVDEQTLTMPLIEGVEKLERSLGGTTLFEFMKQEATQPGRTPDAMALFANLGVSETARADAARMTLGEVSTMMTTTLPQGFDAAARLTDLKVRDLFRFITVESYVRYILDLAESQPRIAEMGGAAAMNAEVAARLRQQP